MGDDEYYVFVIGNQLVASIVCTNGIEVVDVLKSLKYIVKKEQYMIEGEKQFLFGYEESYGYFVKNFVCDKDAVRLSLVTVEMAS